ncbi:MAG: acyltransferase family protein [Hyphomicrobium sp.]|uniref:acyltransferase family protein n=1 Tax=Hyphomicrobium sp. TaxID=82 RepID=UPI0039E3BA7A
MLEQAVRAKNAYRPDLDGLRGIAVLAVVAYHLDLPFASGGFVGVDVFFVLSGYLITRLIAAELQTGDFSIARFYERRIRRIVPALVFVCACTTAVAVTFLLPDELLRYAKSLIATAFSVSNIWFYAHSGYFDAVSGSQPLLHTWSLGIEEQFYIVFPLMLMAVYRWWPQALGKIIWLAFTASLIASIVFLPQHPLATFYLLHARAWELLTGAVVALGLVPPPASRAQSEAAATLGIAAIAVSIFAYTTKTPFPGAAALLPCIGTAMAIWAGERSGARATSALSFRPLTWLGLISYSLYLWHWPLIVFTKLAMSGPLHLEHQVAIAVIAVVFATGTWYFIEQPFRRRGPAGFSRAEIFKGGALSLGALTAAAAGLITLNGMPQRFPASVLEIDAARADSSPLRAKCHYDFKLQHSYDDTCIIGDSVAPSVIVYGDSHGAELSAVLGDIAKARHASIRQVTASGCPPAVGFSFPNDDHCERYNAAIIDRLSSISPTTVVLATYALGWNREYPEQFLPAMERSIAALRSAGHRVIVVGPVPDMPDAASIPAAVARWTAKGRDPKDFSFPAKDLGELEARLSAIATANGAIFVPISPQFCSETRCKPYADGAVLYFDNNHLSMSGAQLIANRVLVPVIWPEPSLSNLRFER